MAERRWNRIQWIALVLLILSLIVRIFLTLERRLNPDEFQHLHASWLVQLGFLPYRDFWDNHSPLLYFFIAPILSFLGEGTPQMLMIRAMHSAAGLAIAGFVYVIARLDYDRSTALMAVLVLSYSEIYLQKTIEVRPDQFLILCWLLGLWLCFRQIHVLNKRQIFLAGSILALGLLFSPKAIVCASGMAVALVFQESSQFSKIVKRLLYFSLGFLVTVCTFGLYLHSKGIFMDWIDSAFLQNFSYPNIRGPEFLLLPQNFGFLLLSFAGMASVWKEARAIPDRAVQRPVLLMISAWIPFLVLVFLMPAQFSQTGLMFIPIFTIFAGVALHRSLKAADRFNMKHALYLAFTVLTGVVIPIAALAVRITSQNTNQAQLELVRYVLAHTNSNEPIFDGNAAYIFRKQAYYYGSLVEGVRYKMKKGEIQKNIPDSLKRYSCRIVLYDDRVSDLPPATQEFLRHAAKRLV